MQIVRYGQSEAFGYVSSDRICLEQPKEHPEEEPLLQQTPLGITTTIVKDLCLPDFKMLSVINIQGLEGLTSDGIVGLAPTSQRTQASVLIDELYWNRFINEKVFSFKLSKPGDQRKSTLSLGSYSLPVGFSREQISWNKIENPYFWSLKIHQITIGGRKLDLSSATAIIDTGNENIVMPQHEFEQFKRYFSKQMLCSLNSLGSF